MKHVLREGHSEKVELYSGQCRLAPLPHELNYSIPSSVITKTRYVPAISTRATRPAICVLGSRPITSRHMKFVAKMS